MMLKKMAYPPNYGRQHKLKKNLRHGHFWRGKGLPEISKMISYSWSKYASHAPLDEPTAQNGRALALSHVLIKPYARSCARTEN
jgi:hypothetical protein